MKTLKKITRYRRRSGVFSVNFEYKPFSSDSMVDFEQINVC